MKLLLPLGVMAASADRNQLRLCSCFQKYHMKITIGTALNDKLNICLHRIKAALTDFFFSRLFGAARQAVNITLIYHHLLSPLANSCFFTDPALTTPLSLFVVVFLTT